MRLKLGMLLLLAISVPVLIPAECAETNSAKVLRIVVPENRVPGRIMMVVNKTNVVGEGAIRDFIRDKRTAVSGSDVIIIQPPTGSVSKKGIYFFEGDQHFEELIWRCNKAHGQICYYEPRRSGVDIRQLMVVHWKSPFDNPRNNATTTYYVEGEFQGVGETGLDSAILLVKSKHPKAVAFVRSNYDQTGGLTIGELPFSYDKEQEIEETMKKAAVPVVELSHHDFDIFPGYFKSGVKKK